jgi:GNAT superfamily N-acetyltransferase
MTVLGRIAAAGGELEVRRALAADVPAILGLLREDAIGAGRETAPDAVYAAAFAAVDADPHQLLLVVRDGAGVVATMQVTFIPGLSRGGTLRAQLEAVRVASRLRGSGLGSAFLAWVLEECRRRGASLVQLTTDARRADARRFYERAGFVASHTGMKLDLG